MEWSGVNVCMGKTNLKAHSRTNEMTTLNNFFFAVVGEDPKVDKFYSISKVEESVVNVKKWKKVETSFIVKMFGIY